jgi:hypothetical protein
MSDSPKMGRPRIEIDFKELDKLCGLQCSLEEIAGWFDCSIDTIEARIKETHGMTFPEYFAKKRSGGKISLRRKQYETAMAGNVSMLIWLGKQYLGQVDKQETELKTSEIKVVIDQDDNDL